MLRMCRSTVKIPSASTLARDTHRNRELTTIHLNGFFSVSPVDLHIIVHLSDFILRALSARFTSELTRGRHRMLYRFSELPVIFCISKKCSESHSTLLCKFLPKSAPTDLIDLIRMSRAHSGENMAEEVATCVQKFGLENRVRYL